MESLLEKLNPKQREAVATTDGAVLILAGPGSGKTRVLTHRVAYLLEKGVLPEHILAVTFTNKAAREMKDRVRALLRLPASAATPFVGTFHSLGAYILRRSGSAIDVPRGFSILDEGDVLSVVKRILKTLELDPKQYAPARMRGIISTIKNTPSEDMETGEYPQAIRDVYRMYEAELTRAHALDFDDLLVKTTRLLVTHSDVLATYQRQWHYVHVDEYQDTNPLQAQLADMLAHASGNIMVVGDIDQAIYSWRGADVANILRFEHMWPNATVVTLEQNYRSTPVILAAANAIIQKNTARPEKTLWTERAGGPKITLAITANEHDEARGVLKRIDALQKSGMPLSDMAVLYRTNAQSRAVEEAFIRNGLPYRLVGGVRFYERKEVKDILAYVRLAANANDTISLQRIINTPTRGIGKVLTEKYLRRSSGGTLSPRDSEKITAFEEFMERLRARHATERTGPFVRTVIAETGYADYVRDGTPEGEERWANVEELASVAAAYNEHAPPYGTERFLEDVALLSDADTVDQRANAVHLMTIHAAKGLEFEAVFLIGLEEGIFPHGLSMHEPADMEEERRLCYVALTRAKTLLALSMAQTRTLFGEKTWNEPSRFLRDIPPDLLARPVNFNESDIIGYETD